MGNIISQMSHSGSLSHCINPRASEDRPRQNNSCNYLVQASNVPISFPTSHVNMAGEELRFNSGAARTAAAERPGHQKSPAPKVDARAILAAKGIETNSYEKEYSRRSLVVFFALAGKPAQRVKAKYDNHRDSHYVYPIKRYADLHYVVIDYLKNNPEKTIITAPIYYNIMNEMGVILSRDSFDKHSHFNTEASDRRYDKLEKLSLRLRECLDKIFVNVFSPGNYLLKYKVVPFMAKYLAQAQSLAEDTINAVLSSEAALGQIMYERLQDTRNELMSTPRETNNINAIMQMGEDINLINLSVKLFLA